MGYGAAAAALAVAALWAYVAREEIVILYAKAILQSKDHRWHTIGAEILTAKKDASGIGRIIKLSLVCVDRRDCCGDELESIVKLNRSIAARYIIEEINDVDNNAQIRLRSVRLLSAAIAADTKAECASVLSERMGSDADAKVRHAAGIGLALIGAEALPFLSSMLSSPDADHRRNACYAFCTMDGDLVAVVEATLERLASGDADRLTRMTARLALRIKRDK